MGSSDFLSEAVINEDSEKMLPAMPNATCHRTAMILQLPANLSWHFWLAFAPGDFYKLLSHYLHPFNSEYIYYFLINTLNWFFLNKSLVCSLEAMNLKYGC